MSITATESTLTNTDRTEIAKSLLGVIPSDITIEEARKERISKI